MHSAATGLPTIVAADRNLLDRSRTRSDDRRFRTVPTTPYGSNGIARIVNWVSYAIAATFVGLTVRRPAVVYASSPHLLAGAAGWLIARIRRAAFVLEVRDLWPRVLVEMGRMSESSLVYRGLEVLEARLYRAADAIVVLAEGSEAHIRQIAGPDKQIVFIPNGADTDRFASVEPNQEAEPIVFIYAGAHGPANGLDLLLDAADELDALGATYTIRLVGDGVSKAGLVRSAEGRGLANVEFRDAVPKADMPAQFQEAQVGLHVLADVPMFRYGVSPNKLFEYMAAGLPVITNTPGEVSAIVEESGAGVATASTGLADGMRAMLEMGAADRRASGEGGRAWVRENRSRAALARRVEALLDEVARPR